MTGRLTMLRIVFLGAIAVVAWLDVRRPREKGDRARIALGVWSAIMILFVVFLWFDHVPFAGHLDLMEGVILQHVAQAAHGLPIYPAPTPAYVPLAYNPLYYYLCVPFTRIMGLDLPALRLVAIIGMAVAGMIIYAAVRDRTNSAWWGIIALALYATAYRVMDAYLDNAHSDSWLLAAALAGTYVIGRSESRSGRLAGVVLLVSSFWFKQHGALFVIGGVLYLTWREGLVRSWPYWAVAILLGPVAYAIAPLGVDFHYFTWDVPRGWSKVNVETFARVIRFAAGNYLPLLLAALIPLTRAVKKKEAVTIWHVQFIVACASAVMGSLDWGSSDNVFIPFGAFTIILGTFGLAELVPAGAGAVARAAQALGVAIAFAPLTYAPQTVILSPHSREAYTDLIRTVRALPGPVYAPNIAEFAGPPLFSPGAHWVAVEDMARGPGHTAADEASAFALLDPALHPAGTAYLITNRPLSAMTAPVSLLAPHYVLAEDFGTRFAALTGLPKRYNHGFPRYLYEYRQ
jgi:hypothetical protein